MNACCKFLDDYFDEDLDPVALSAFLESTKHCPACQEAIRQQAELDKKIRVGWQAVCAPSPKSSLPHSNLAASAVRPPSSFVRLALPMAVALLIGIGLANVFWKTEQPVAIPETPKNPIDLQAKAPNSNSQEKAQTIETQTAPIVQSDKHIVMPVESTEGYTLVRVFQTVD